MPFFSFFSGRPKEEYNQKLREPPPYDPEDYETALNAIRARKSTLVANSSTQKNKATDITQPKKPPPSASTTNLLISKPSMPGSPIKATDVPQWLWSRDECRTWMEKVLIDFLNVSKRPK